jgi:hypothetical protein
MNNNYSFYLFCKLRAIVLPSDEAYDLLYSEDLKLFEDYNDSIFNLQYKGEYECILDYLNCVKAKQDKHSYSIPSPQLALIRKALDYYVKQSKVFNQLPTDSEAYELFDMMQLSAMMNYDVSISISDNDKNIFAGNHGIDFPVYYEGK